PHHPAPHSFPTRRSSDLCSNVGHRAARVMKRIQAQLERYLHTCFSVAPYEPYIALAEKLNQLVPGKSPKKSFLANSGAEAVENADRKSTRLNSSHRTISY